LPVGKKVALKIVRDGVAKEVELTVAEREDKKELAAGGRDIIKDNFGMAVQDITPDMARQFGMTKISGVIVTQIREGSAADDAGIQPHDIILQVNRVKVSSVKDFQREISKKSNDSRMMLLIKRGKGTFFVALRKE
jgi:serine protease Do